MRVSVRIFGFPLEEYGPLARAIDVLGFHQIWIPDHVLSMAEVDSVYPYRASGRPSFEAETPFSDPLVMLAHLAAVTTRVRLGVGVYVLPMRHPLHAARQILSAHTLAAGRLELAVGVGWAREEFEALDASFAGRGARAEEMVAVMRGAWTGEPIAFAGEFYRHATLQMSPPLAGDIGILWGGTSQASVERAVRMADGLYAPPGGLDETTQLWSLVQERLRGQGRDPSTFRFVTRCPEPVSADVVAQMRDAGLDEVVVNVPRQLADLAARESWLHEFTDDLDGLGVSLSTG